jgi:hypothetical protein
VERNRNTTHLNHALDCSVLKLLGLLGRFVWKVRTSSGAVAVQVVTRAHGVTVEVEHVGSAHDDATLGLLVEAAQGTFDLPGMEVVASSVDDIADWIQSVGDGHIPPRLKSAGVGGSWLPLGCARWGRRLLCCEMR